MKKDVICITFELLGNVLRAFRRSLTKALIDWK